MREAARGVLCSMRDSRSVTHVVLASGHLVDAPGRQAPRFPPSRVAWVTDRLREIFDDWGVGPATVVISGGARGADIIAAEEGYKRGAHVILCLALPADEFERRSVGLPGTDWSSRFRRLLAVAEVRELAPSPGQAPEGDEVFARANEWMVDLAHEMDAQPHAVVVWDGMTGDGPGGTSDLVQRLGGPTAEPHLRVIDPTPGRGGTK
jgi:hypothetical protein